MTPDEASTPPHSVRAAHAPAGGRGVRTRLRRDAVMFLIAGALLLVSLAGSLAMRLLLGTGATVRETRLIAASSLIAPQLDAVAGGRVAAAGEGAIAEVSALALVEPVTLRPDARPIDGAREAGYDGAAGTVEPAVDVDFLLRRARQLANSWREASDSLTSAFDRLTSTPSILPTTGRITSSFTRSRWHPILERSRPHEGLDIVAPYGTPIVAAARGVVVFSGYRSGYGLTVEIDHGYGTLTRYAHASRALVRRGAIVERGDTIGRVGRSGLAVGSHLHYEVLVNGRPADPRTFLFSAEPAPQ